jgi:O-antigen ligase
VQPATFEYPARYQGFEQNPNTAALLLAVGTPLAALFALEARSRQARAVALAVVALFAGSIAASGSRGAMLGGLAGALVVVAGRGGRLRSRLGVAALTVAVFAACVGASEIPEPKPAPSAPPSEQTATPTRRTLFGTSGRFEAWRGAIEQAKERPVAGYGFGTEQRVFVDRYAGFVAELPENSFIGAALQLGLAGLGLLVAIAAAAAAALLHAVSRPKSESRSVAAACAGVGVAALALASTQSYLFSVGNIATTSAWLSLFLLVAAGGPRSRQEDSSAP